MTHDTSGFSHANYTAGGAAADFDGDGWQDLFVISGGDLNVPDHLFINNGDGTFTDEALAWGLGTPHKGKGVAVGDFNNDGWMDLFVTSAGPSSGQAPGHHKLYRNNGNGTFTNIATAAGVNFTTTAEEDGFGASFGDIDLDGDLDLFVAGFADDNAGIRLFRNNGDETFTDITAQSQMFAQTTIEARSFTPRLVDMDGDQYPDLPLVGDFGTSRYFRNNTDGTFTDVTNAAGVAFDENGMGGNVGDWNGDGRIDWYVTSIYNGNNWTGNKLYINTGSHSYVQIAEAAGVDDGGYGWGALAVDFNHDGRLDIAETNGDSGGPWSNEQSYLWIQNPGTTFNEVALTSGFEHFGRGRGMVNFDYDNDGDQDVVIFAYNEPLRFYENLLSGSDTNWIRVFLDTSQTTEFAPNGYGSVVSITIDGVTQTRAMTSGDNFLSHSELSTHFGIGTETTIDTLRVKWPDASSTVLNGVNANQTITVHAGTKAVPGDLDGDGLVNVSDVLILLGAWGPCMNPCPPTCAADVDGNCTVGVGDLLLVLANWS